MAGTDRPSRRRARLPTMVERLSDRVGDRTLEIQPPTALEGPKPGTSGLAFVPGFGTFEMSFMARDAQKQLSELERLAEELDVRVCYEPMTGRLQGRGGLCKVRGEYRIIMDRRLRPAEKLHVLAGALRGFDTAGRDVSAPVRDLLVG